MKLNLNFLRIEWDDYTWNPEMESGSESESQSSSDEDVSQEYYSDVYEPEYGDPNICLRYVLHYISISLIALKYYRGIDNDFAIEKISKK